MRQLPRALGASIALVSLSMGPAPAVARQPPVAPAPAATPGPAAPTTPAPERAWSHLDIRWVVGFDAAPAAPPAFDGVRAFVPLQGGGLTAVDLERGTTRWHIDMTVSFTPAVGDGHVYVASDGEIAALAADTGAVIWRHPLPAALAAPLDWDTGWLLASTAGGDLAAFRASDGALVWRTPLGTPIAHGPVAARDRLYAALEDGRVVDVDLATGTVGWTRRLGTVTSLAGFEDQLIVGTAENAVFSLDPRSGWQRWRIRVGGDPVGRPSADANHLYFVALDNVLRAVDRGNGNLRWIEQLPTRPSGGPMLVEGAVVVPFVSTALNAFSREDGAALFSISASGELAGQPYLRTTGYVTGARLIAMSRDGHLRGFGEPVEPAPVPLAALPGVSVGG